jgi:hypothetical protein
MYPYKAVICGCTKNSASYIYRNLENLYAIKPLFSLCHFVLYENDSHDDTVSTLQRFKENHSDFAYISEKNVAQRIQCNQSLQLRPQIIAHGRNTLLQYVSQMNIDFDYLIMVDTDDVIVRLKPDQFQYIFQHDTSSWDALFANCLGKYYDIWALRIGENVFDREVHGQIWNRCIDYDCWEMAAKMRNIQIYVYNNQKTIQVYMPLIRVDSAFGGLGIYKYDKIRDCKYSAIVNGRLRCEHVEFHRQMAEKNNARMFICPKFLLNCQPEHTKR